MVLLDSLWPSLDSLVNLGSPVNLVYADDNLPRPLSDPLDSRINCICLKMEEEIKKNYSHVHGFKLEQ